MKGKKPTWKVWGLRLLALVLAIVIYHVLSGESPENSTKDRDNVLFKSR